MSFVMCCCWSLLCDVVLLLVIWYALYVACSLLFCYVSLCGLVCCCALCVAGCCCLLVFVVVSCMSLRVAVCGSVSLSAVFLLCVDGRC